MSPAIQLDDAVNAILSRCSKLAAVPVSTSGAAGRVLAEDVVSPIDLPPFANSAMDGYALRAEDSAAAPVRLPISGESRAGAPAGSPIAPGTAIRISTGAVMPEEADAVVRVEDVELDGDAVLVSESLDAGHDVRPAGDDIAAGETVLRAGMRLRAGELAMLASVGRTDALVHRRPRVNVVSTGDELAIPGEALLPGQIYDSNGAMLAQLVADTGAIVGSLTSRVADSRDAVDAAIEAGLKDIDVLILCGGVSMGEHDHVKSALLDAGVEQVFWQVAMRPGHPTWFGTIAGTDGRSTLVFGLPGNPVSAYVTFHLFVLPALNALHGEAAVPLTIDARYSGPRQKKRAGFVHVVRCQLSSEGGAAIARLTAENQRSHALTSAVGVDGLALLPEDVTELEDGDQLRVRMLRS